MQVSLAQVAIPDASSMSIMDYGVAVSGAIVFLFFLWKAYTERRNHPAAPYVGIPNLVITAIIALLVIGGDSISLNIYGDVFAVVLGFVIKVVTQVLLWPFWFAGLIIVPISHIAPKIIEGFKMIYAK